jgi:hypothetical protein
VLLKLQPLRSRSNSKLKQQQLNEQRRMQPPALKQIVLLVKRRLTFLTQLVHLMFVRVCKVALVAVLYSLHLVLVS